MYNPPAFQVDDLAALHNMMRECRTANFVTATTEGPMVTLLPMFLDASDGEYGTLYGHLARANTQWKVPVLGKGLAVFTGAEAYITPSWYATKAEHGKVVPTWNYSAVHASGPVEFFEEPDRLLEVVNRLTNFHEKDRSHPWAVSDAPEAYIAGQLRGIVGLRMPIQKLEGKNKMSQNRSLADRIGVRDGLAEGTDIEDRIVASMIPDQ